MEHSVYPSQQFDGRSIGKIETPIAQIFDESIFKQLSVLTWKSNEIEITEVKKFVYTPEEKYATNFKEINPDY